MGAKEADLLFSLKLTKRGTAWNWADCLCMVVAAAAQFPMSNHPLVSLLLCLYPGYVLL